MIASLALLCLLVFLFVPWQVAFMGCWIAQLFTCSAMQADSWRMLGYSSLRLQRTSLQQSHPSADNAGSELRSQQKIDPNEFFNLHLLLLMTWLLPFVAPVLVVWVRTLYVAGLTTPFDSDHFFINVAPFLVVVDYMSITHGVIDLGQR